MTPVAYVLAAAFLIAAASTLYWFRQAERVRRRLDESQANLHRAAEVEARAKGHVERMVVPLTWAWIEGQDDPRLRHALIAAFSEVQAILAVEDVEMADRIEAAPEPPRRLPRYAPVPPYLATPEDVAGVPAAMARDLAPLSNVAKAGDPVDVPSAYTAQGGTLALTYPDGQTETVEVAPGRDPAEVVAAKIMAHGSAEATFTPRAYVPDEEEIELARQRADGLHVEGDE